MKAYYVFEKFTEESDPIADMGMSRVKFGDIYKDIMEAPLKEWNDIIQDLVGKTLEGMMHPGNDLNIPHDATIAYSGGYRGGASSASMSVGSWAHRMKVKVAKAGRSNTFTGTIVIEDEKGQAYTLLSNEEYIIS
jgi:hypothetical protein